MQWMRIGLSAVVLTSIALPIAAQQWPGASEMPQAEQCAEPYSCIEYLPLTAAEARSALGYPHVELEVRNDGAIEQAGAAQERCKEAPVEVVADSPEQRQLACSAANKALQLLGRCKVLLRRSLHVEIVNDVRHPLSGPILGLFDTKRERVLVTTFANVPALVRDTPYSALPQHEFYKSLIVHEVVHGVMHQNLKRQATSHSAYEYPAYALQLESLPSSVREQFLHSFDQRAIRSDYLFNDFVLFFNPFFFAAHAYQHFKASGNGCAHLAALLEGEVDFISAMIP